MQRVEQAAVKKLPWSQITVVYIYLLLSAFPLWCGFGGYQRLSEAKYSLFLLICGGYLALMALLFVEGLLIGECKIISPAQLLKAASWTQKLIAVYLCITWVSTLLSPYFPATIFGCSRKEGALSITVYCLCFLLVSVFGRVEKGMLFTFAASALVVAVLAIIQLHGGNPFTLYPEGYHYFDGNIRYAGEFLSTIGNVDLMAAFLSLAIPAFWVALLRLKGKEKLFLLLPLGASVYVLLKMWVLAGIVGVFGGALLALPVIVPAKPSTRRILTIGAVAIFAGGLVLLRFFDFGNGFLHELHEIFHGNWDDSFGSGRIYIWKNVLKKIPQQLWFGSGPDTLAFAGIEPFSRYDAVLDAVIISTIDTAHNEYLNILYHQGLFALFAYVGALGFALRHWISASRRSDAIAILGTCILCYCVQAFFGFSMYIVTPLFVLALALLEKSIYKKEKKE